MLEDNETSVELRNIVVENRLESLERGFAGSSSTGNVPVGGVKVGDVVGSGFVRGPDDRRETHLRSDGSNSVVDVSIRRSESVGSDTDDVLDHLHGPSELGDDFLVGEGGERLMRPGVYGDLVTSDVF